MLSTSRREALTSTARFALALSVALAAGAKAELPGRRVAVAGTSLSYPYTVEIPSDWYIYQEGNPNSMLLLVPPGAKNGDPGVIGVVACTISLADPEQIATNLRRSLKGVKIVGVKEIDGVRGVLAEWDQGDSTLLGLMLPTSSGCVQFMGRSPRAQFAARRPEYERIIFSVRRAQEAEATSTKTPPSDLATATPAPSPDEQELSPKGIDKQKFDGVYRAAKSVKEATGVGVNFPRYSELVQTLATEVSIARDKASSPGEKALAERFARVAAAYRDAATLWQHKISDASTTFLYGQIMVAISRVGTGEMLEDPEMRRIVDTYKITTQTISTGAGGGRAITINPVAVQIPWIMADLRMAAAEKAYLAATVDVAPSVQAVPSYIEELKQLAALRDQGVITKEEFEAKKSKLLGLDKPLKKAPIKASPQKAPPPP
jgi:Short C-terminal domain